MRSIVALAAGFVCLAAAGCVRPYTMQTHFDPSDATWSKQPGTASISGQAFLRTRGGDVKTCAGSKAFLAPSTPYTREAVAAWTSGRYSKVDNRDPQAARRLAASLTTAPMRHAIPMRIVRVSGVVVALIFAAVSPAKATRLWNWHYGGAGVSASGKLTTDDPPNKSGCYRITAVTGSRNGVAIISLQPAGTAIPGNEPYAVDNLVCTSEPQLTGEGFGFGLADGTFANAFFGGSHTPQAYMEFFSSPAGKSGDGARQSESPVVFGAEERH